MTGTCNQDRDCVSWSDRWSEARRRADGFEVPGAASAACGVDWASATRQAKDGDHDGGGDAKGGGKLVPVMVVRGTKKFLDRVGRADWSEAPSTGVLGDWYANLLFWRPQAVLFVNERTRLPVVVPFAPGSSILERFPSHFAEVATRIGVPGEAIAAERASMAEWALAKTANRSVLGTMNEFTYLAEDFRRLNEAVDLLELSLWLAQVPCSPLFKSHGSPDRELRAVLASNGDRRL